MRLNSIKLAGFKSFAEPTTFLLPGQMVGVVGPNGCGKSNIMDAVRWVLGESKASELRGESMQDVIFSGTTSRKPASRASVELVFDNSGQRAGGQWGQYGEIAVKRILSREGGSSYHINGQQVRRKDVQDVFLGTGLGPRAYAIIGQGTISRIIESKPEELRLFLEEAAGVSKYKERRKETEARLADTRENLTRIEDILRELTSNLGKLEAQAEVAARYTDMQARLHLAQQQLWLLRQQKAAGELEQARQQGQQAVDGLQAKAAEIETATASLEELRQQHYAAGEAVNDAQGALYEASAEVGKLEAEIRFELEGKQRAEKRSQALAQQLAQWESTSRQSSEGLASLEGDDASALERSEILAAQVEEQAGQLPELEQAWRDARERAEQARQQVQQTQQQFQVLAAEQRGVAERKQQLQMRMERIQQERQGLQQVDEARLAELEQSLEAAREEAEFAQAEWVELDQSIPQLDDERRAAQEAVQQSAGRLASLEARLAALRALQEKVQADGKLAPWLTAQGLADFEQLWKRLQVEAGWEQAAEAALRERMAALPVSRLDHVRGFAGAETRPPTKLVFYAESEVAAGTDATALAHPALGLPALASRIRCADARLQAIVADWLHGCYSADALDEALAARGQLREGEQILLAQGHSVTRHSLGFYAEDSEQAGLLARAQEIEILQGECEAQTAIVQDGRATLAQAEAAYQHAASAIQQKRNAADQAQKQAHALQVEVMRRAQEAEQVRTANARLEGDWQEMQQSLEELEERSIAAEARFEELDTQLAELQGQQMEADEQADAAERRLNEAREQLRQLERQLQESQFGQQSIQHRRQELQRNLFTADQQLQALQSELEAAQAEVARYAETGALDGLEEAEARKIAREDALRAARQHYDELGRQLRAGEEARMQLERTLEPMRQHITELRLAEQAAQLAWQQFEDLLLEAEADKEAVAASIAGHGVKLEGLQAEIDRTQRQIDALGPVNLAALQELGEARERKDYLDAQASDLNQAMQTLEDAIRTIDAETRELLKNTFETVNRHFGEMFPELFGGGQARLIMTGDEILDAGVQVMAQPPGKRNQTIHLLSGGEKALTAIALVFAIFQLNPAPFCLLDEVDAPLDDSNTERYARLVKRMSAHTQFLYISHNKIAMEMAGQLIGVTMQERGVSRIVAVDMQEALSLADS
ncbi:chromosome segregation protein SMC [Corticibacter populi]|uniref:Chromosome partition protein Smc n=1 Tax=Corticibacter populi TaxID=1550736 RepID=A0A3M6QZP4_9BURK|nr:chromosome segregation protein SMC [Corticibacter populi]RMX08425.1 chromosome segregation protein SMC [Corticibacter populi]RZS35731.1 condensin subunit Smc [Corticibacter populi]